MLTPRFRCRHATLRHIRHDDADARLADYATYALFSGAAITLALIRLFRQILVCRYYRRHSRFRFSLLHILRRFLC